MPQLHRPAAMTSSLPRLPHVVTVPAQMSLQQQTTTGAPSALRYDANLPRVVQEILKYVSVAVDTLVSQCYRV